MTPKIATCCYCGTRAALVLTGNDRHELACRACGAPLHDLKMLKAEHPGKRELVKPSPVRTRHPPRDRAPVYQPKRKRKHRKSIGRWILEEAWDAIEDILD